MRKSTRPRPALQRLEIQAVEHVAVHGISRRDAHFGVVRQQELRCKNTVSGCADEGALRTAALVQPQKE